MFMLARTRLLRPTPRATCVRLLAHKAASDASNVPERPTAAGLIPGGEQRTQHHSAHVAHNLGQAQAHGPHVLQTPFSPE